MPPRPTFPDPEPEPEELDFDVYPDLAADVAEFRNLDLRIKTMTKRRDEAKGRLRAALEANGQPDDKGSLWLYVSDEDSIKLEKRHSQAFDAEMATEVLQRLGLYDKCIRTITVLDEDAIAGLVFDGEIPDETVRSFYSDVITWAFKGAP